MLKKRIIATVLVKNDRVVQSFGFTRYLPVGSLRCVLENLDRWSVDEISVLAIDRSINQLGPNLALLGTVAELSLSTPISYGGGIRNAEDACSIVKLGFERIMLDTLTYTCPSKIASIARAIGSQAIMASLPAVALSDDEHRRFDYITRSQKAIDNITLEILNSGLISEVVLIDAINEGRPKGFDERLLNVAPKLSSPVILFGGISSSEQLSSLFGREYVSACAIGNFLNYREHAFQEMLPKETLKRLRAPSYRGNQK